MPRLDRRGAIKDQERRCARDAVEDDLPINVARPSARKLKCIHTRLTHTAPYSNMKQVE